MLGVVHSIAKQTAAQTPEDFIEHFSRRVHALSATQNLLVRSVWEGVEIEDLVRAQLAHFADLVGSRIVVQGPKMHLRPLPRKQSGSHSTSWPPTLVNTGRFRWMGGAWMSAGGPIAAPSP